jgi:quercetin dioxygenase-like cupin family protein
VPAVSASRLGVLLVDDELGVAMPRFARSGTIDKHSAPHDIEVVCLDGSGFPSVDGDWWALSAGELVRSP